MFSFDTSDVQRVTVSAIGALALSAASVVAAAAPARAEAPATKAAWQSRVASRLDGAQRIHLAANERAQVGTAVLNARFDAAGRFTGADLARSSGDAAIDRDALTVARTTHYPSLPPELRGAPQTVSVRLYYAADEAAVARAIARDKATLRFADAGGGATIAAR